VKFKYKIRYYFITAQTLQLRYRNILNHRHFTLSVRRLLTIRKKVAKVI